MSINSLRQMRCAARLYKNVFRQSSLSMNVLTPKLMSTSSKPNTTVDIDEVQKHSSLMKEWWDLNGPLRTLHSYNILRVPFVRDGLVTEMEDEKTLTPLANKKILDVGCGGGILSEALARIGANVTGIDASKELIECATEHSTFDQKIANNRPNYICTTVEEHSQKFPNFYDAVVASEIIEHVTDKELFIKSCVASLKNGGRIFITTPTRTKWTQVIGIYISEYVLGIVPKGTHDYEKLTTPNELTFLLERNGCHVELIHGMMYYPFVDRWSWADFDTLMFAMQAIKLEPET